MKALMYFYNDEGKIIGKKKKVEVYFPSSSKPLKINIKLPEKGFLNCEVEISLKELSALVINRIFDCSFRDKP